MGIFTRNPDRDESENLRAAAYNAHRPLVAAAQPINLSDKTEVASLAKKRATSAWQDTAYDYYDLIGEIKYSANLIASVISRIRLYAAYITDESTAPSQLSDITNIDEDLKKDAARAMRLLASGSGGIPGLLKDAATNLFITGECYLVQERPRLGTNDKERWTIRSIDEVVFRTGRSSGMFIKSRKSATKAEEKQVREGSAVARIWSPHPRYSDDADSSMLGILELCDELLLLSKTSRGVAKSRLNAGMLLLPDDLSNISQGDGEYDENPDVMAQGSDDDSDSFEEELERAITTPIADEGSAASVSPFITRGPAESLNAIRHLTFERSFDESLSIRADKVLDRILAGLDIPKEVVQGIGDAKYANGVQVEENLYKAHIEPMTLMLCDNFTDAYFKPVMRSWGWTDTDLERLTIWYDPSAITSKPSKSEAATVGYDAKIVSAAAWRRFNGFSESDAPTELEIGQRLAVERGMLDEATTRALLQTLLPQLMSTQLAVHTAQDTNEEDGQTTIDNLQGHEDDPIANQPPPA